LNTYWVDAIRALSAAAAVAVLASMPAAAAPPKVESFDGTAWERLQRDSPRPSAIVFTATYCANCPAVIAKLSETLQRHGAKSEVVAVVIDEAAIDGEAGRRELLDSVHYKHASRLFMFSGNEAALRYRVDPRWRGVTPYIALLGADGKITFSTGAPSDAQMAAWLEK
jgi:thiol-disulfide isomerase/thioredoxin